MTTTLIWQVIFYLSLGLALYAFLGYPLLLWIVLTISPQRRSPLLTPRPSSEPLPRVSVVVAAYNERDTILATLKTLLIQDYPAARLEIVVFSDGSTDGTDQLVRTFAAARAAGQPQIRLIRYEGRIGKTECQNRTVEHLGAQQPKPEIVVFSDGNILWQRDAVRQLVLPFADQRVAATTGALHLIRKATSNATTQLERVNEGLFRRLDHVIKQGESRLLSTVGVNGPIYAVRRSDYIRLQPRLVSDLVLPVLLVARGKRVEYVPEAVGLEPSTTSVWQEFRRKRRLVTQGFVALPLLLRAATPLRRPGLCMLLLSHKFLRWIGVELLGLTLIATLALVLVGAPGFGVVLVLQVAALLAAGLGLLFSPFAALAFFVLTNVASLVGAIDYLRGETATRWRTERPTV